MRKVRAKALRRLAQEAHATAPKDLQAVYSLKRVYKAIKALFRASRKK